MGATESSVGGGTVGVGQLTLLQSIEIPASLRSVFPFLYDAQRCFSNSRQAHYANTAAGRCRVAISCINKAFGLLTILNIELDGDAHACLDKFRLIRSQLFADLGIQIDPTSTRIDLVYQPDRPPYPSHEILIAEVILLKHIYFRKEI